MQKIHFAGVLVVSVLVLSCWVFTTARSQQRSKEDLMRQAWAGENAKRLDTYGKVLDQHGDPVPGVNVKAGVGLYVDFTHSGGEDHYTDSDAQGNFSFVGIHGAGVGFTLQKEGYEYNERLPASSRPENYSPDPSHPIVFTIWKLKGPEPLVFARIHAYVPCDGSMTEFNLLTGHSVPIDGDLRVKLTRNPVDIIRGKPFNWSIVLGIADGGLVEQADAYPNEAPATGYQPSLTFNMPMDMPNWSSSLRKSFYFEGRSGMIHGRVTIDITANFQPPPTAFFADIYTNPSGSRNLEYDPKQRIKGN